MSSSLFKALANPSTDSSTITFGYLPKHNKGETLTKKIFRLKDTLRVDTMKLWDIIINKMPRGDNEFLKKLDLSEPYSW